MEAMMYMDKSEMSEKSQMKALLEIFEQISVYNEIGYQTSQLAACAALNKIKTPANSGIIDEAIIQLNILMDRCSTASNKIDRLTRSGSMITNKVMRTEESTFL